MDSRKAVLITGGSGYLGQFALEALRSAGYRVVYTYGSTQLPEYPPGGPVGVQVSLASGESLQQVFHEHGPFHTVINCAAVSQPAVCEKEPAAARAVNVPTLLTDCLLKQRAAAGLEALLVHLSTDQVYDGSKANWAEGDACQPVNAYGLSKLEAEQHVQECWPHHVILRSSIIYGPLPATRVGRMLFLQFMDTALREGKPTTFFEDEFRSPTYVGDITAVLCALVGRPTPAPHKLYNMGGPERLSRLDMARKVALAGGYSQDAIVPVPAASVSRGVASPADISMTSERLAADFFPSVGLTLFSDALRLIYATPEQLRAA